MSFLQLAAEKKTSFLAFHFRPFLFRQGFTSNIQDRANTGLKKVHETLIGRRFVLLLGLLELSVWKSEAYDHWFDPGLPELRASFQQTSKNGRRQPQRSEVNDRLRPFQRSAISDHQPEKTKYEFCFKVRLKSKQYFSVLHNFCKIYSTFQLMYSQVPIICSGPIILTG